MLRNNLISKALRAISRANPHKNVALSPTSRRIGTVVLFSWSRKSVHESNDWLWDILTSSFLILSSKLFRRTMTSYVKSERLKRERSWRKRWRERLREVIAFPRKSELLPADLFFSACNVRTSLKDFESSQRSSLPLAIPGITDRAVLQSLTLSESIKSTVEVTGRRRTHYLQGVINHG